MEHDRLFDGIIKPTVDESTASWSPTPSVLERRPNIVMIVLDDVGYSQLGCYGSEIDTPALDSLAADGLRYANFHVTPICSPTRTCLLTGRNHHSVGMGRVAEMVNGFPNTRGFVSKEAANLAEMLRPHGYHTLAAGKWHLASINETSPAGPYDHWPLQRGFDRFHGFLAGETNQWNPELIQGNERIEPPEGDAYHLSEDIVDQACKWLRQLVSADTERPFFLYVAFAAGHSPHHVPRAYADKYAGRFDAGWDAARIANSRAPDSFRPVASRTSASHPATPACRSGTNSTPTRSDWRQGSRRSSRASSTTPTSRSLGCSSRSTLSASATTPSSWRFPTTAPVPRADPTAPTTTSGRATASATAWRRTSSASTTWAVRSPTTTTRSAGPWPATRRTNATRETPTRVACAPPCSSAGPTASRPGARPGDSSTTSWTSRRRCWTSWEPRYRAT